MPFTHEIIDLQRKPAAFLAKSPTGMVPLLELDDGSVVTESVVVARRVAADFSDRMLLPPGEEATVDRFVKLWTDRCEPAYYDILCAGSEPQARVATAALLACLADVEDQLWQRRLRDS